MTTPAATQQITPQALRQSEHALQRMDRRLLRAEWLHRGLLSATAACAIAVCASTLAGLFGLGNALMTDTHKNTGHAWPTAALPSWTIAKTGLAGLLGSFALLAGAGAATNGQARRIGRLGAQRFGMYVSHEHLRKAFNAQTIPATGMQPAVAQFVPTDLSLQKPVTLTIRDLTFTRKPRA